MNREEFEAAIRAKRNASGALFDNNIRTTINGNFHEITGCATGQWYVSVWDADWKQNKKYAIDPEQIADEAELLEIIRVICAMAR